MSREKLVIVLTVLVSVIGFGIVIPILPFYVSEFGASASTVTLLFASFSLLSFISSPFLGNLSDRIGRRPVLIGSTIMTAIGWFVFAGASSIPMLFLGRMIDGAGAGNFSLAQSYLVDISKDEKDRAANLGLVGAAFGVGFMLGPMLGGMLSKVSHAFPFWFAGGLSTLNAISAYFFLPESLKHRRTDGPLAAHPLKPIVNAINDRELRPLYVSWIMFTLAFVTSQSVFALFMHQVFSFDSFETGAAFTVMGLIVVINQAALLKVFWLRRFSERTLEVIMLWFLLAGMLVFTLEQLWAFALSALFLSTGQSVLRVVLTSQVAGAAPPTRKGETLGILASLMSVCMVIGPVVAGPLFELDERFPYFAAAAYLVTALFFAVRFQRLHPQNRTVAAGDIAPPVAE